nr:hypothetical protein [Tanacetum cinerariifolium]
MANTQGKHHNLYKSNNSTKAQIRRIFLDRYGLSDVRVSFFIFLRLSSRMRVGIKSLHEVTAVKVRVTTAKLNLVPISNLSEKYAK